MESMLKAPVMNLLKIGHEKLLSNSAFKFNLRRYTVAVPEDRAVTLQLRGASADGTEAVTFQVATLPSGGELYDVDATGAVGAEVTAVPTDLTAAAVRYVPNADAAGIPFDVFKYRAKSAAGAFSYKTGVVVSITALDDPPSAVAVAVAATRAAAARVTLTATQPAGETAAGPALNYSVTRLPARGTLYKAAGTSVRRCSLARSNPLDSAWN